jgi:hypothetical protein
MSDFERVLERLLGDPAFKAALAADPDRALAGYALAPEERETLGLPVSTSAGVSHAVEERSSKSGVVGLVGPVVTAFGVAGAQHLGSAPHGTSSFGSTNAQGFGDAPTQGTSFGQAPRSGAVTSFGAAPSGGSSFGEAPRSDGDTSFGDGQEPTESFGTVGASQGLGDAPGPDLVEATGYRTWVDVDGDGTWDAHTAYERADGGVDIHVDVDHDGRADFIGHDVDRDGLVDSAEYDTDRDGAMDTRMVDDNGDGWLDRRERIEPPDDDPKAPQTFGNAPLQSWGQAPA